jgi:hypothetical protein
MKMNKIFAITFLIVFSAGFNKSFANGVAAGIEFDLLNNVLTDSHVPLATDHIFIGGDAFATYYNDKTIDYGYGFRGRLGYKILGAQAYGIGGVGHFGFNKESSELFKSNTASIYGYGVGYNFPLGLGVRLNRTFFNLEKIDNSKKSFAFTEVQLVLVF